MIQDSGKTQMYVFPAYTTDVFLTLMGSDIRTKKQVKASDEIKMDHIFFF